MAATYERHPLSAQYEDLQGQEWLDFLQGIIDHGFDPSRPIILHEGKVLDGWQRYRACQTAKLTPEFAVFVGEDAQSYVDSVNLHRRQLSAAELRKRANDRRDRVMKLREAGDSLRIISEKVGASVSTAARDLKKAGVPLGTPAKVKGKDGKTQKAKKEKTKPPPPICNRCKKQGLTKPRANCPKCQDLGEKAKARQEKAALKELKKSVAKVHKETEAVQKFFADLEAEGQMIQAVRAAAIKLVDVIRQYRSEL